MGALVGMLVLLRTEVRGYFLSLLRSSFRFGALTHGSRRGLHSVAASRLEGSVGMTGEREDDGTPMTGASIEIEVKVPTQAKRRLGWGTRHHRGIEALKGKSKGKGGGQECPPHTGLA